MPAPGDQHDATANPFEPVTPRISEYTAAQIATLQSRLEKLLGPEFLSSRAGPSGQKVWYIAAEKVIGITNDVFGFNGWSSSIQNIQVDFVDENTQTGKISLGLSVIMRVTLRDGTYHEDIGYGHMENSKTKAAAFEKAKKEGTTDALKRTLRNFGNVTGNCIYDKDYLSHASKMKVRPIKFSEDNLYRHPDFAKKEPEAKPEVNAQGPEVRQEAKLEGKAQGNPGAKPEAAKNGNGTDNGDKSVVSEKSAATSTAPNVSLADSLDDDFDGDFYMADFGVTEDGHPDEVVLSEPHGPNANDNKHGPASSGVDQSRPAANQGAAKQMQPPLQTRGGPFPRSASSGPQTPNQQRRIAPQGGPNPQQRVPAAAPQAAPNNNPTTPGAATGDLPAVGFFSAKSADLLVGDDNPLGPPVAPPNGARAFNPHADSPSIRKTAGIDHNSTKPVGRNRQHVQPLKRDDEPPPVAAREAAPAGFGTAAGNALPGPRPPPLGNAVNPSLNPGRQIGAPGAMRTRPFVQPGKRPGAGPGVTGGGNRAPLGEVTTNGAVGAAAAAASGNDAKRQKMA